MKQRTLPRRMFAAFVLIGFAIGSSLFWNNWAIEWVSLITNLAVAILGLIALHYRWRASERPRISHDEAREEFS